MLVLHIREDESILIEDGLGGFALIKHVGIDEVGKTRIAIEAPPQWDIVRALEVPPSRIPTHLRRLVRTRPVDPDPTGVPPLASRLRPRPKE